MVKIAPVTYSVDGAWFVRSGGDVDFSYSVINSSYGRKNRRTRTTISIYGILDQMENIDLPRFIMMIPTEHSPDREVDNCSCTINSSGEAYWSYFATVTSYSYGINSPDTNADRAFLVFPFGLVDVGNYGSDDVTDSYGYIINLRTRDGMELGAVTLMVVSALVVVLIFPTDIFLFI